jgi:acyl-CoA thioesterase I
MRGSDIGFASFERRLVSSCSRTWSAITIRIVKRPWLVLVGVAIACAGGCGAGADRGGVTRGGVAREQPSADHGAGSVPASQPAQAGLARIVVLGDSLTAGLGLPVEQSYPSLLQQRLNKEGFPLEVVNAGVSGDTSAGGLSRLDWALEGNVKVLIVALGGNDGLRGLPVEQLKGNLAQIIERAQARGIRVILAGMEAPPNYGRDYIVAFHKVYPALAQQYKVPLVRFLLEGVAGSQTLNQPDGIHPTAEGARIVADHVWSVLKPVLDDLRPVLTHASDR